MLRSATWCVVNCGVMKSRGALLWSRVHTDTVLYARWSGGWGGREAHPSIVISVVT
jgi:hypothetical protein